jgi:Kef-type K+ transport system membrane component KefB
MNIEAIHTFVIYNGGAEVINVLGDFGLICLMLIAGLGSSIKSMKKERIPATLISIFGIITPFLLGLVTLKMFGYSRIIAIISGIALSITAEATTAKALIDTNKLKSKLGTTMLEAGIMDDIIGL